MPSEIELCTELFHHFWKFIGLRMDVLPVFIILTIFQNSKIYIRKLCSDTRKMLSVATISTYIDGFILSLQHK